MKPISLPCSGFARIILLSLGLQCCIIGVALSYQTGPASVSGTVTSLSDGQTLPGVTVVIKGTNTGSVTDLDGRYVIDVPNANDILVFSSIGYLTQEVPVNNRSVIDIVMEEDIANLEEVVVIGYGTQRKSDLTGAVASIKADKLLDRQSFSVSQALQGRLPGVDVYANTAAPGEPARIRIRGINSINSGVDPLFVVDGVIGINANFLDPNNIESVEVLKDASSTAIYGARGANGVIIITTKRGLEGKTVVSYDGFGSYSVPSKRIPALNATEFMEVYNLAFANAEKFDPAGFADGRYQPNNVANFPELFDANGNPRYNTNWEELIYRPAWAQNHHINIQGGAEKTVYSLSFGYSDQNGIMRNSYNKRGNIRFTLDNRVNDWLRVGGSVTGILSQQRIVDDNSGALNVPRMVMEAVPIVPVKYPDGSWGSNADWPGMEGGENPVRLTEERQRLHNRNQLLGDIYVQLDFSPNLNFRSSLGYDINSVKSNHYSGRGLNGFSANQKGYADINAGNSIYWQSENYFTYKKDLFNNHKIDALLGFSWQESYGESVFASAENFIDDFYGWHNLSVGNVRSGLSSGDSRWALNSYFGRVNYNIADKYIFTATGRFDGSSKFGKNNRFAFFPSFGAAWRISEEGFFDASTISNLKLRASAGATGNQEIGSFNSLQFLGTETVLLGGERQTSISRTSFGNPDLKWEVTNQFDLGLEVGLWEDRLTFEADLYYKRTNDLLLSAPIPWSTGLSTVTQNIGSVENRGLELLVNSVNVNTGTFSWASTVNWAANRNKVLKLGVNDDDIFPGPWFLGQTNILRVGEPIGSFWGYKRLGTWGSDEADEAARFDRLPGDLKWGDLNNDGVLDARDETIIGNAYPQWTMNISNTLTYKNFDFTFDIRFVQGVNIVNATKHSVEDRQAIANSMATVLNAWTPENQDTYIAQIRHYNAGYDTHMDDWWVEDGSFIRGQNFVLGYSVPTTSLTRLGLQRARIYGSVQNLFVISDYSGYDPEATTFGGSLTQNIEFFQYPKPRTFNLGVNVSF
jgi:TonB-linked SusC/RagA family outer membrane protein